MAHPANWPSHKCDNWLARKISLNLFYKMYRIFARKISNGNTVLRHHCLVPLSTELDFVVSRAQLSVLTVHGLLTYF